MKNIFIILVMLFSLLLSSCNGSKSDSSSSKDEDCAIVNDFLLKGGIATELILNEDAYKPFKRFFYLNRNESIGKSEFILELTRRLSFGADTYDLEIYRYSNGLKKTIYKKNDIAEITPPDCMASPFLISNFAYEVKQDGLSIYMVKYENFFTLKKWQSRSFSVYSKVILKRIDNDYNFEITKNVYYQSEESKLVDSTEIKNVHYTNSLCFKHKVLNNVLESASHNHDLNDTYGIPFQDYNP